MIPKVIHYCWFGRNPLPPLAVKCIESWKKFLPNYEIKEWNEDNFNVDMIPYTSEAYKAKKYAFVSDYARFWILYNYGGLYFDTDVEVIKPLDDIIAKGNFMGCEGEYDKNLAKKINQQDKKGATALGVAPGLGLGINPGLGLLQELLDKYATLHFINFDGTYNQKTIVQYTTELLCKHGLKYTDKIQQVADVLVYPKEYFCPKSVDTWNIDITINTYTIHHYDGSWLNKEYKFKRKIRKIIGNNLFLKLHNIKLKIDKYL
ncbi:MAG: glycosyl transferase [Bacteroidales bacterium]|nr:glycosyl transferase [Bacteroidales bacterium]